MLAFMVLSMLLLLTCLFIEIKTKKKNYFIEKQTPFFSLFKRKQPKSPSFWFNAQNDCLEIFKSTIQKLENFMQRNAIHSSEFFKWLFIQRKKNWLEWFLSLENNSLIFNSNNCCFGIRIFVLFLFLFFGYLLFALFDYFRNRIFHTPDWRFSFRNFQLIG